MYKIQNNKINKTKRTMKRNLFIGLTLISAIALVSCKSSESSYKKAYEKAQAQEQTQQQTSEPVQVQPVVTPVQPVTPVQEDNSDLRSESLTALNGGTLKAYNVVCGSFSRIENANNLCTTLKNRGYSAIIAQNPSTGMYRVIATSSATRSEAVSSRDKLRATYPDAWLLYVK